MKLLLTSGGVKNESILNQLKSMLNKPINESTALSITTSSFGHKGGFRRAYEFVSGKAETPMCDLGWKQLGLLELTTLEYLDQSIWIDELKSYDVLLVNGGDPLFLNFAMKKSGIIDIIKDLDIVYVGLSAGSMIMTPNIGEEFVNWKQPDGTSNTLGLVDFSIFPHLHHPMLKSNHLENAKKWAKKLNQRCFAIDDNTAISVMNNEVLVISEGEYYEFNDGEIK